MYIISLALPTGSGKTARFVAAGVKPHIPGRRVCRVVACTVLMGVFTFAALRSHDVCGAQGVTTNSAPPVGKVKAVPAPIVAVNNKVTLPSGPTIKFVGITDFKALPRSKQQRWWKPDGSPLTDAPSSPALLSQYRRSNYLSIGNQVQQPNIDFVLETSGIDLNLFHAQESFTPTGQYTLGGNRPKSRSHGVWQHDTFLYCNSPGDMRGIKMLHLKLSRGAWRTYASTSKLPATVSVGTGATVTFLHPGKNWMKGLENMNPDTRAKGKAALGVLFRANEDVELEKQVVVIDDRGKSTALDKGQITSNYGNRRCDIEAKIPRPLLNHIREYHLQVRPYQYVDFPDIHLEPASP